MIAFVRALSGCSSWVSPIKHPNTVSKKIVADLVRYSLRVLTGSEINVICIVHKTWSDLTRSKIELLHRCQTIDNDGIDATNRIR